MTIGGGSQVTVSGLLTVSGTIVAQSINNWEQVNSSWQGQGIAINAASVQIDTGGSINADGQGYGVEAGPGGGAINDSNGGSYGGVGGVGRYGTVGAAVYGSATNPIDLGSGGGIYCCGASGAGGGAVTLTVIGTLTNNGVISANGGDSAVGEYVKAGGGSGGSLNITANTLAGTGMITATGGNGTDASGGGGRIALLYGTNNGFNLAAQVMANAGATATNLGTAGTIYFNNQPRGTWLEPTASVLHGQVTLEWFIGSGTSVNVIAAGPQTSTIVSHASNLASVNWNTSTVPDGVYELRLVILDASGNVAYEIPKRVAINNSVIWHSGTLTGNEGWSATKVHVLDGNVVIPAGVTLTIDPGTVVKAMAGAEILVKNGGVLNALGVIFTTIDDCTHGGDTQFNGCTAVPVAGEWNGIVAEPGGTFNENSQTEVLYLEQVLSGTVDTSQSLLSSFVYQIDGNLIVSSGVSLTIQPGAVLKFSSGAGISVQQGATLVANGTVAQPIYFTSIKDDSVAGDTNGDGNTTTPAAGDWGSIAIDGATASFNHVQMRYGGGPVTSSGMIAMIESGDSATVTISNSILAQAFYDGVLAGYPNGGDVVTVTDSVLTNIEGRAINSWPGSTVHVVNDTFSNDGLGVMGHGGTVDVANTIVANCNQIGWGGIWGSLTISHSDVWSKAGTDSGASVAGTNGNISFDPVFVNETQGDYRLNYGSPAIDAADGTLPNYPITDFMGVSRYTDPLVTTKTGLLDVNGNYPDMGAYEFVQNAPSDIDLVVTSVTGPSSASAGDQVQIAWTDANIGAGTTSGSWHDSIYLVSGANTNPMELLAGQVLVGQSVVMGPGSTTTNTATVRVPGAAVGNYHWEVRINTAGDIFEGQNTSNNSGTSIDDVAIDVPALPLDSVGLSNSFSGTGQSWWYKLDPGPSQSVSVNLSLASGNGSVQLFIGQGYVPTPQQFDIEQQQWNSASVSAVIPSTSTQPYYVTAYAQNLTGTPAPFSISAIRQQFSLSSVQPSSIANNGSATIEFIGAQLTSGATYQLLGSTGVAYSASSVYVDDSAHVYATFAATGLAPGSYTAQVIENGMTVSLNNAVTVTSASSGGSGTSTIAADNSIEYNLIVPEAVRAGYGGTVTIQYTNTSGNDVIAPLMTLVADGGSVSFIPPQCSECSPNFAALYTNMVGQGQMLGINQNGGVSGVLPAGATGSLSVNFEPSNNNISKVKFNVHTVSDATADTPIDWSGMQEGMRPSYISTDAWGAIFANFMSQVGSTWGSYNAALAADSSYLSQLGKPEYRVNDLQVFELTKAGLSTISQRYFLGAFGYGASHPFDMWGEPLNGGWLMHLPSGTVRSFTPNPNSAAQYIGEIGDYATIALQSDQTLSLTEKSGVVYHFIPNPNTAGRVLLDYIQDLNGNRITANYTNGLVTSATSSNGDTVTYTWNSQGRIAQMTDSMGRITTYTYDTVGTHLLSIADPAGTTSFAYVTGHGAAQENAIQSITYPDGTHTYFQYDIQGRTIQTSNDGGAQQINFAYDSNGAVTVTDALGNVSHISSDDNQAMAQYIDPQGYLTQWSYDSEAKMIRITGPDSSSTSVAYDANGNPSSNRDPVGNLTTTQYAANADLLSLTDPLGNTTEYEYDSHHNATELIYPNRLVAQGTYDSRGNLTSWTNRRGQTITYTYGSDNLLTRKTRSNGASVTYAYDNHRNLQSVSDATGTISFSYDIADRLMSVTYPNGRFLQYSYDSGGRRSGISDGTGYAVSYSYDAAGRLSKKNLGNGAYTTYGYDAAGNLLHLVNYSSTSLINSRFDYSYDASGRRTRLTTLNGSWQYDYDANGQLASVTLPSGSIVQYSYDAAGNRVAMVSGGASTAYDINNLNQYTAVGGAAYGYDADGNLISKQSGGNWSFSYDDEDRLVAVSGPTGNWTYQYDALGNRIAQVNGSTIHQYLVDPTGLGSVMAEFDGSGKLVSHFTYGLDLTCLLTATGSAEFYQFDGSANTATVTGTGGDVLNTYSYLPFGEKIQSTVSVSNPFTYAGQYGISDDGDGLYYMRARYYDPLIGRFISQDPIGFAGGINSYVYVGNDPVTRTDPSGKITPADTAVAAGIGALVGIATQGVSDLLSGQLSPVSSYVGSAAGGAATGALVANGVPPVTAAVIGSSIGNTTTQVINELSGRQQNFNTGSYVSSVGTAAFMAKGGPWSNSEKIAVGGMLKGSVGACVKNGLSNYCNPVNPPPSRSPLANASNTPGTPPAYAASGSTGVAYSSDPNGKITVGYGDQGFVPAGSAITYTIYYENQASATAPAQQVVVTDALDANLDWSSVRLSAIGFNNVRLSVPSGLQNYSTQASVSTDSNPVNVTAALSPSTGVLTWTMQSVDKITGGTPANPMAGFLPPDNANLQGEGFVSFTVKPKSGLVSGTAIYNQASIVFDMNAPISTNRVTNTIDSVYPISAVDPLPAVIYGSSFLVSWSGNDSGGAGIAAYDVYAATDSGSYTKWQSATAATSATFTGALGHSYSFYSMAIDNVGHRQQVAGAVQTTTTSQVLTPVITWATPAAITYGTILSRTQLNATANVPGTFTYSPAIGTVLAAGSQALSVTFTPTDTTIYATATASVQVTVNQATPMITWTTPAAINYGTALSSTQLNATANVAGTFTYSPAIGTVLETGSQTLSVTFTPTDTTNYTTATASVTVTVNQATSSITQQFTSTHLVYPGATNVKACVAGATKATPTGSIQIKAGNTVLTTLSLGGDGCAYWYISPGLNAGTYSFTSVYSGDANNPSQTSVPTVLTVSPVPVNMSTSCWNSSFPYGGNYQCTVNVSSNAGSAQGNITYSYDSGVPVAVPLTGGNAQFSIAKPLFGNHNVVIGYAQQTNYAAAQPQTTNFTVISAPVQVSLTPSTWYATVGTAITFSVALTSWSAGVPDNGAVAFYDGSTLLSTVPISSIGQASYTTSSIYAGSHTIEGVYLGSSNYASASTSVTVTLVQ